MPDLSTPTRDTLPRSLQAQARWERLGPANTPAMLVHPNWDAERPVPLVIWMHGRTVNKELDPGRYLRWMRAGIGACAIDLPGHGERFEAALQQPDRTFDVIMEMAGEIDGIVQAIADMGVFDMDRVAIGGMSAGGMATIARLCQPHGFRCAAVEGTTGSWQHQRRREMFRHRSPDEVERRNPIHHLDDWREIPFQAIHSKLDEWVSFDGQAEFIDALRSRYTNPAAIEFVTYEKTGAPFEHAGFGRMAADAKNRQRDFLVRHLLEA